MPLSIKRETNDELVSKLGCLDNCVYEDSENSTFCFKTGSFPPQCIEPAPTSSKGKQRSYKSYHKNINFS